MNTQSGEAPLLFKLDFAQLWTNLYQKYYGQDTGWMAGFVLLAFNLQLGAGRNSVTFTLLNFNVTASWNARRVAKVIETPAKGPQIELRCFCGAKASAMAPLCEECIKAHTGQSVDK